MGLGCISLIETIMPISKASRYRKTSRAPEPVVSRLQCALATPRLGRENGAAKFGDGSVPEGTLTSAAEQAKNLTERTAKCYGWFEKFL
jgi:hypothetical protein